MSPCRCRADDTSLILKLRERKTSKNINNNNDKKRKKRVLEIEKKLENVGFIVDSRYRGKY